MQPIPSTAEILVFKMLGNNVNKKWIDWAYDMLRAGFETENLVMLAGELEPYNQFELQSLADKVLKDFNLTWDNPDEVYKNYVCYLVSATLEGRLQAVKVLGIITNLFVGDELEPYFEDFCLLHWACDELTYLEQTWYWNGATRENINAAIMEYFVEWKAKCK